LSNIAHSHPKKWVVLTRIGMKGHRVGQVVLDSSVVFWKAHISL
jgi:hypothetical protein